MKVLSLFDGISCGQIALNRLGINYTYYASEVDKYAIEVTQKNYPDTIQLGDVTNWRNWPIDWSSIDLLIGGSPCQGFSFAGKQLAFDDPRSKLFFVYAEILNHIKYVKPDVKFLLENVKMKKEYLNVISDYLKVTPVRINSSHFSAQNRTRYYWFNFKSDWLPSDDSLLKDILKPDDPNKVFMTSLFTNRNKNAGCLIDDFNIKAKCLAAYEYVKNGRQGNYIKDGEGYRKLTPIECERLQNIPDDYTKGCSNTQRYIQTGNAWTVGVIVHILKSLS
jgi:DNA-cytosine methyltransferase